MTVELHRVAVPATDRRRSAAFLARILGVPTGDGVGVDFVDGSDVVPVRCTFLLTEDEFDAAYARLLDTRTRIWADPDRTRPGQVDHRRAGRALCFVDPDGHVMEIVTRPVD